MHHTNNLFCRDISAAQEKYPCSDDNGTAFFQTLIALEDPDVFVFTGEWPYSSCLLCVRRAV